MPMLAYKQLRSKQQAKCRYCCELVGECFMRELDKQMRLFSSNLRTDKLETML